MELYTILQKAHSGWAYLALLMLVIVVANALIGVFSKKEFTEKDRKIALFGLIATHVQLLFGLILYFVSPLGFKSLGEMSDKALEKDRKIALFGLIATHVQLLFGLILYFVSPLGFKSLGEMSDKALRLTSLEHPFINILAIALITIGWSKHKKIAESTSKFKTFAVFYGLGLLLILIRIPWSLWLCKQ